MPPAPVQASAPEPAAASAPEPDPATQPIPELRRSTAAPASPVPPAPVVVAPIASSAPQSQPSVEESDDDHTVIASRRRTSWSLHVDGGESYALVGDVITLGRKSANNTGVLGIVDETRTMSKKHATLQLLEGAWHVTDLGSTNGTYLRDDAGRESEVVVGTLARVEGVLILGDLEATISQDEGRG